MRFDWFRTPHVVPVHRAGQKTFGFWGPHTSSIDWCEDNYLHVPYIAETWNTLSNIPFMLFGLHGALHTAGLPHRGRYALLYLGIAAIGAGSFTFHATLNWYAQVLLDELPMIYVSCACLNVVLQAGEKAWWKPYVPWTLLLVALTISEMYFLYPNPVFHQAAYATIQICTTVRQTILLYRLPPDSVPRRESAALLWSGTFIFLLGFAIWNVDNQFCESLTAYRGMYGDVVGALTQGHAWWHLLTGIGSQRIVVGISYLTLAIEDVDGYAVAYTFGVLPYVRRKTAGEKVKAQ